MKKVAAGHVFGGNRTCQAARIVDLDKGADTEMLNKETQ